MKYQKRRLAANGLRITDFPMLVKRALSYASVLWVSRTAHYTDITKKNTLTAKSASVSVNVLKISASSPGTWGNNLQVVISESSLEPSALFNVSVLENGEEVESLSDMSMDESSDTYIENSGSAYLAFEITGSGLPRTGTYSLTGGADGTDGMTDADYIGSASNTTGLHVFDDITDAIQLAVPGVSSPSVITAGLAYCEARGDLLFVTETPFNLTPQEAVDFRLGSGAYTHATFVSNYGAMYYPKIKIYDVARQKERYISTIGNVLGVMAINDYTANESYIPAVTHRGRVLNALGVDVNISGKGRLGESNYLCDKQVNPVCMFEDTGSVICGMEITAISGQSASRLAVQVRINGFEAAVFQKAAIPEVEVEIDEFISGGSVRPEKFAGRVSIGDCALEKGIFAYSADLEAWNWLTTAVNTLTSDQGAPTSYKRDVEIVHVNRVGTAIQTYLLKRCSH